MTVTFRMKVNDVFQIGEKTIFAGELDTAAKVITNAECVLKVDGNQVGELHIQGEVHTGKPHRDLWTTSPIKLTRETLRDHDVWLISKT
jgi:hypothetical protein